MKLKWDFHELYDFGERIANVAEFEKVCEKATKELAKVFQDMLISKTPLVTGQLAAGWAGAENCSYTVKRMKSGFKVELVNRVPYAKAVNDGHKAYNQFGGPYPIHDEVSIGPYGKLRGRIAVTEPYEWQQGDPSMYVFGHFFVERSIVELENGTELNKVLQKELNKWFRWCVNGK